MPDNDVTAILEHIRDGAESEITHPDDECGIEAGGFCVPHAALLLVAAVEGVLELAELPEQRHYDLDGNWEGPVQIVIPADMIRGTIRAALTGTGKEGSEDG